MKKIITTLFFCIITATLLAQAGRIRISFVGFDCYRETWDDILQTDGKGDEVYFNFGFSIADRSGNSKNRYEKRTPVYGDATGQFSNRISAGSAVDMFGGARGGIKGGDQFRCNDIVGEYDLADGDIVTVIPTAWEHDPVADNMNSFLGTIGNMYNAINQKVAPLMIGFNIATGNLGGILHHGASLGIPKILAGGDQGELGRPGTRPIGMEKLGYFSPKLLTLNTPNLSAIANSNFGNGNGIIAVNYDENAIGNSRDHGNYTILLKIEFFPKAGSAPAPAPAPAAAGPVKTTIVKTATPDPAPANTTPTLTTRANTNSPKLANMTIKNEVAGMSMPGIWAGTYGNGTASGPSYYSFEFKSDGKMYLLNQSNTGIATGTYKFENNILTGTYTYTNGGTFSITASLDASNSLQGTWGSGTSATGGGKWTMVKK